MFYFAAALALSACAIHRHRAGKDWAVDVATSLASAYIAILHIEVISLRRKRITWVHTIDVGEVKGDDEIRAKMEEYRRRWSAKKESGDAVEIQTTEA